MEQSMKRLLRGLLFLLAVVFMVNLFCGNVNAAAKKKTLIVYFSRTGTTEQMAKKIGNLAHADIVRLKTKKSYPSDYSAMLKIAREEQDNNARPRLATKISGWNKYDTILLGYPIWYGTQPMAINTFLESYNFSGKKVIPFCTSGGSGISQSISSMKKICKKAAFGKGMDVTDAGSNTLKSWLKKNKVALKSSKPAVTVKIAGKNVTKKTCLLKTGRKARIKVSTANLKGKKRIQYTSSNKRVATVTKKGVITAGKAGAAKIHVTVKAGKKSVKTWIKIKVVRKNNPRATKPGNTPAPPQKPVESVPGEQPDPENKESHKVLVAYFSCTGTTENLAEYAADYLNADLTGLVPEIPYTDADLAYYTDGRADREQNDPSARPAISGKIQQMEQYDTILLGYPIWHGQAPRIISTFLESYDFSGKTIVPFCTSHSSGIGSSALNLHSLTDATAVWKSGKRFASGTGRNEIRQWLEAEGIFPSQSGGGADTKPQFHLKTKW